MTVLDVWLFGIEQERIKTCFKKRRKIYFNLDSWRDQEAGASPYYSSGKKPISLISILDFNPGVHRPHSGTPRGPSPSHDLNGREKSEPMNGPSPSEKRRMEGKKEWKTLPVAIDSRLTNRRKSWLSHKGPERRFVVPKLPSVRPIREKSNEARTSNFDFRPNN